jgi:MFS transporter, NNP family, nitrate/nitrite transporter
VSATPDRRRPTPEVTAEEQRGARQVLTQATVAFTLLFAVWVMFAIVGLPLREEFGLSDDQFALLAAIPILTGSVLRIPLGIITDRFGGRVVFTLLLLVTAVPAFLLQYADSYPALLVGAFFVGLSGASFAVGIAWVSAWYPADRQGFALGVFGAGNVGASITKLLAPWLVTAVGLGGAAGGLVPGGWRFVPFLFSLVLVAMAASLWFGTPRVDRKPAKGRAFSDLVRPMGSLRAWRFGLYYVVVFGAYVALSLWLPRYYVDVFGMDLARAGLLTALFIFPASLLRPVGGYLADRFGARRVMYLVFTTMTVACALLAAPEGHIVVEVPRQGPGAVAQVLPWTMNVWLFTGLIVAIGVAMGVGKAAVFVYIPEYFPDDVGAVGGLVGAIGGLGGFILPLLFSQAEAFTGMPQGTFMVLLALIIVSFAWLHWTVYRMLQEGSPGLQDKFEHPAREPREPADDTNSLV